MQIKTIDNEIRLIPYYRNDAVSLAWYQNPELCKQVDNTDSVYDLDRLHRMYDFLSTHGECYYIEYCGKLVGDVTLRDNCEIAIVVCREYQNRRIGRRCVTEMLKLAREKGMECVKANIYSFNLQSQRMFASVVFLQTDAEWFIYRFPNQEVEKDE